MASPLEELYFLRNSRYFPLEMSDSWCFPQVHHSHTHTAHHLIIPFQGQVHFTGLEEDTGVPFSAQKHHLPTPTNTTLHTISPTVHGQTKGMRQEWHVCVVSMGKVSWRDAAAVSPISSWKYPPFLRNWNSSKAGGKRSSLMHPTPTEHEQRQAWVLTSFTLPYPSAGKSFATTTP